MPTTIFVFSLDIDDCQKQLCQNNGTCQDLVNDYQCNCTAGFNGNNCEIGIEYFVIHMHVRTMERVRIW